MAETGNQSPIISSESMDLENKERPQCSFCLKDIYDSKQLLICKGCKKISHLGCALK